MSTTALSKTNRKIQRPLSEKRRQAFLENLARTGIYTEAARIASPHSSHRGGCASSFKRLEKVDANFAAEVVEAQEIADSALLMAARKRAVTGCERGVFQKGERVIDHDGKPATHLEYSDRLLELLLKSRFPDSFVEKRQIEHSGKLASGLTISSADLASLSEIETTNLRQILTTIGLARGEIHGEIIEGELVE